MTKAEKAVIEAALRLESYELCGVSLKSIKAARHFTHAIEALKAERKRKGKR